MILFPFSVVFTGLLRSAETLRRSMEDLVALRARGLVDQIRIATWDHQVESERWLVRELRAQGVEVMGLAEPAAPSRGHIWQQMVALHHGLAGFTDETPVLKTRTDLHIDPAFLEALATTPGYFELELPPEAPHVFEARVWVPWFELTAPFYLADECFMGRTGDLRKLVNFDTSYDLVHRIGTGVTHIRRFIHPFRRAFPLFERALENWPDVGHFKEDRFERLAGALAQEPFLELIASYYATLASYFRVQSAQRAITFRDWSSGAPQPPIGRLGDAFRPGQEGIPNGRHLFAHDDAWLRAALAGRCAGDALGRRFGAALERVRAAGIPLAAPRTELQGVSAAM